MGSGWGGEGHAKKIGFKGGTAEKMKERRGGGGGSDDKIKIKIG